MGVLKQTAILAAACALLGANTRTQAEPPQPDKPAAQCAFQDEDFKVQLRLAFEVAQYFQERGAWPSDTSDFRNMAEEDEPPSLDQAARLALAPFESIQMHTRGRDLYLDCQLMERDERWILQLSPAPSITEIIQTMRIVDEIPAREPQSIKRKRR